MLVLISIIMSLAVLPLFFMSLSPEYFGKIYLIWGIGFLIFLLCFTYYKLQKENKKNTQNIPAWKFFSIGCYSWLFSLIILSFVNFSPLCLGQDNKDGTNDFFLCCVYMFIQPLYMSFFVLPLMIFTSWISSKLYRSFRKDRQNI